MRNAKAQRRVIMGCVVAKQQAPEPHVRHADSDRLAPTRALGAITTASAAPC